jgi:hypothetical protein
MMAARRDIAIYQGDTYGHVLTVTNDATPPVATNVTGRTFAAQLRRRPQDSTVAAQFAVDMSNAGTGVVQLSLTAVQTGALAGGVYSWDVHMVTGSSVLTLVAGDCVVTAEVTR